MMKVMSGIRATGKLHIGHYFGSLVNWLELQKQYECYFGVMDWHGMTSAYKTTDQVQPWIRDMFAEFVAWGIDAEKHTVFVQSAIPEHMELFMIFANLTPMGWLERVPTWKDAEEEAKATDTHNLGRFSYPVLQAADVAIYKGERVPVGADQVAHLELTREIIRRFNHIYAAKWPEPQALLTAHPSVPGLDGRKMSKSYQNGLELSEEQKILNKKIKGMPTDPQRIRREDKGDPTRCNVFTFHKLFSSASDLTWATEGCLSAGIGCGDCKGRLFDNVEKMIAGPREKKRELLSQGKKLDELIKFGNEKASQKARQNLAEIKGIMKLK